METLSDFMNILKVAFGLGLVIFLHELGHFLLAKWNGVKVEKFSIGFGPTLFGFRKGETEYVLAAVPLGGFVKMLGEGPDEEASKSTDPRAYPNKSVGARMAIISAGVIMNLVLGLACFVYAYGRGMIEMPARVGAVMAGAPAYDAGMRPGDEIVAIDGRKNLSFTTVTVKVRLSRHGQVIHFDLKRPGRDDLIPVDIEPRREANAEVPGIGIYPSDSLTLIEPPYIAPPGLVEPPGSPDAGLKPGDKVVKAGPSGSLGDLADVPDAYAWQRLLAKFADRPLDVVVERAAEPGKGKAPATATAVLPPNRFVDFGLRFKAEPVAAVRGGSPAEKAGFRKGDTVVKVGGRDDFDPMRLPTYFYEHAGKPVEVEVTRAEPGGAAKTVTLTVTPDDAPPWVEVPFPNEPLDVPGLGLAFPVRTKVGSVAEGSPAAKAGIKPGDVISGMTLPPLKVGKKTLKPEEFKFDEKTPGWPSAFQKLQLAPAGEVKLVVNHSNKPLSVTPEPVEGWFHPLRGTQFDLLFQTSPPLDAATALRRGFDDTVENILNIYAMLRSLVQSRVSMKNLGGPITIARVAYSAAGSSLTELIHFLGILSINLAVLNFLPIPPLDGGQMVFLAAEKVRGRPLPESALIAGTYLGLLLVLVLMAFVIYQDVSRLVTSYF